MVEHPGETVLTTSRLLLRPYTEADVEDFHKLIRDNAGRLAPAFPGRVRLTHTPDECRRLIGQFKSDWILGQVYAFGVWQRDTGEYLGDASIKNFDRAVPKAEIGYYLDQKVEGQGFATEMLEALIRFGFRDLALNKLFIRCAIHNGRSYALAQKCGFVREGLMRQDFRDDHHNLVDTYYYGLTRSDFDLHYETRPPTGGEW